MCQQEKGGRFLAIHIQNARILTPFSQQDGSILISGERISDVGRDLTAPRGSKVIDAKNLYLVPGFIDLHVRGGENGNNPDETADAITALGNTHAYEGTTTILPTITPAPIDRMEQSINAVRSAQKMPCNATIAGAHLYGPFLSPDYAPRDQTPHLLTPESVDWQALVNQPGLRMVSLSPELPGATAFSDALVERGIVPSIACSGAGYDQVLSAIGHGFSDVSGIYTNCSALHAKEDFHVPGVSECALAMDELTVQVVADGRKLPLMLLQVIFRCKGAENIILVTESGADSRFTPMAAHVRNVVAAGISLRVALRMSTVNPARRIGVDDKKGRIAQGYDADVLLLDETLNVRFCMVKGKIIRDELDEM